MTTIINNSINVTTNTKTFDPHYIAGLIEGDGWIHVPKTFRDPNGIIQRPTIGLSFNSSKDVEFINVFKSHFGGSIELRPNSNGGTLRIRKKESLIEIVQILNGNLRASKIFKLYECIDWIKHQHSIDIEKKPADNSCLSSNAWFSGFVDTDGCFSVRIEHQHISTRFSIAQASHRLKGQCSNGEIMEKIAEFCHVNLRIDSREQAYRIQVSKRTTCHKFIEYFEKYPLLTAKYLDYKDWVRASKIIDSGLHYEKRDKIEELKNSMNNQRTYFNWDHLSPYQK